MKIQYASDLHLEFGANQSLKAHFFGQKFKVLKVDKTLVDYYTKLDKLEN